MRSQSKSLPEVKPYVLFKDRPAVVEYAKDHGLDLGPKGSDMFDLYESLCASITKLERRTKMAGSADIVYDQDTKSLIFCFWGGNQLKEDTPQ